MHINTNKYAHPLLDYTNKRAHSSERIDRVAIQKLFNEFISEFPSISNIPSAENDTSTTNCLSSVECIEQSKIQLVEKLGVDNNFLQHIFLQVKNGCIEGINQLFILVLYTNLLR